MLKILTVVAVLAAGILQARGVRVAFDPRDPAIGPFPTDYLTIFDAQQKTSLRVNMPLPNCTAEPTTCRELTLINQFDGFALQPRIRVRFSGPVDPDTLRGGIWLVWLDQLSRDEPGLAPRGYLSGINEVVWDPATNTAYARPDDMLDQSRRYLLIVTSAVRDTSGDPVEADPGFAACLRREIGADYCADIAREVGQPSITALAQNIVGASMFTTMSATAFMESARRSLQMTNPAFRLTGTRPLVSLAEVTGVRINFHVRTTGERLEPAEFPLPISLAAAAGLGRVAFGSIQSPRFLSESFFIPPLPTAVPVPVPQASEEIFFQVYLPSRTMPAGGYPVAIVGHGLGNSRFDVPTAMIPGLVGSGMAVIAINAVGHGFGPEGTVEITTRSGETVVQPAGGRQLDLNGNGQIEFLEGAVFNTPQLPIFLRDALRQTALDLMQLTRAIRSGMDLNGDGTADLSRDRIAYFGLSLGGFYGALLHAIEPDIPSAVLNVAGGGAVRPGLFSPSLRTLFRGYLGARSPMLLNAGADFNAELPLRYEPVRVVRTPGAIAIQEVIERLEWIETPGMPAAFAPHFRSSPLGGVPYKRTLFQFAVGDQTVVNPSNVDLLRAANGWDTAVMYRADLARAQSPSLPANPHSFIARIDVAAALPIVLVAQGQAAEFLLGSGHSVPAVPEILRPLFQPATHLLERLNFTAEPAP